MTHIHTRTPPHRQRGLSIVELMVTKVISLTLLAGVVQIFLSSKTTYRTQEALSRLQENARFAVSLVNRRVRLAGYMGCLSIDDSSFTTKLNGGTDFAFDLGTPIEGFEANGTGVGNSYSITASNPAPATSSGGWTPALDADLVGRAIPGSDVVVVRNASTTSYPLVEPYQDSAGFFVRSPNQFAVGDILIATDCVKSTAFQGTNVTDAGTTPGGTDKTNIRHAMASMTPGNVTATWTESYQAGAELMRAETSIYYIGQGASGPSLFHRSLQTSAGSSGLTSEELVEGVESMQIVFGEDTSADGSADAYRSAAAVANWDNVVSLRIALLMRSNEEVRMDPDTSTYDLAGTIVNPVDDRRLRDVVSTTITLRNRVR